MDEHFQRIRGSAIQAIVDYEEGQLSFDDLRRALVTSGSAIDNAHPEAKNALEAAGWALYVDAHTLTMTEAERPAAVARRLRELKQVLAQ